MSNSQKADPNQITLYSLQTCKHCKEVKKMLQSRQIRFRTIYVDLLVGSERNDAMRDVKRINPSISFPTLSIGGKVIVGFKPEAIEEAIDGLA